MQPVRGFDPDRLRAARTDRGLTQAQLAELMDVERTYVVAWETTAAYGSDPSPGRLCQLADILDVAPHELTAISPDEARLGDLRAWRGMTQRELAEALGMPASTLAAIETGRRRLHDEQAGGLAQALEATTDEVVAAYQRGRRARESPPGQ